MGTALIGEQIDWADIASKLKSAFDQSNARRTTDGVSSEARSQAAVAMGQIASALVEISAEQRAALKHQRDLAREQPGFGKPRS